jgi:photosystem II stability/assembly factor-like uncharacterized protein
MYLNSFFYFMNFNNHYKFITMKYFYLFITLTITAAFSYITFRSNFVNTNPDNEESFSGAMQSLDYWTIQRAYPNKYIPANAYYKAYESASKKLAKTNSFSALWQEMGPQNIGGRTIAIDINPLNPNTIYAGSASGGLWRSYSGGVGVKAWSYVPTGFPVLSVGAIAENPADTNVIYIGTGEVYGYQDAIGGLNIRTTRGSYGIGLLKSSDNGKSWVKSIDWSYNQTRGVEVIKLDPVNPNIVYAGTTEGIYKSTDAGASWNHIHSVLMTTDILINTQNTQQIIAACGNLNTPGAGIYKSTNGGTDWFQITSNIPAFGGKILLAGYPPSPNVCFASVGVGTLDADGTFLLKSTDFGSSWTQINTTNYATYQGWYSHFVIPHPTDPTKLLCAGIDVYKSTDGGTTLTKKSNWAAWYFGVPAIGGPEGPVTYSHADHHAYAINPANPNMVYFGNDGGVFRTTDFGETFQGCNGGYQSTQFYKRFGVSKTDSTRMVGGLQDNATAVWEGTLAWRRGIGGDGCCAQISPSKSDTMYGSSQYLNINRSINKGVNWTSIPPAGANAAFNGPFLLAPSNPKIIYAGGTVVFKSTNAGTAWTVSNNGNVLNGDPVLSIAVSYNNPDIVYVTTAPNLHPAAVFLSTNGGTSWTNITSTLPDRYPVDISVDPRNSSIVYITFSGFGTSHLFRSTNSGTSWIDIGQGLPDVPTSAVCIDPFNSSFLYVGNDLGVFYSVDNGISWNDMNSGLVGTALVMDLSVSPLDYKLVVATHGRGVYKIPLSTITPVELIAFNSQIVQSSVVLNWTTATETNNYGFEIQRSTEIDSWRTIGFVNGHGTSQEKNNYSFKDPDAVSVNGSVISYRLKQNDFNGKSIYSNVLTVNKNAISTGYALQQNYPNPFNGGTVIKFSIPEPAVISLILYDITGKEIKVLAAGNFSAGQHQVSITNKDFEKLSSGIYLYKLSSPGFSSVKKMIVLK